jgi:hypothetical protein
MCIGEFLMGIFSKIKKGVKKRDKAHKEQVHDEPHEEGTRRGEARGPCYHIDPVTKKPQHPEGH